MKHSNDLRYSATKTVGNEVITASIRLNDECKNGHQDFSITGTVYEAGKPRTDRNMISAGCCHDHILKAFPEFKIFVDLHLCDYDGAPMHAVANGFYHLSEGFNSKSTGEQFRAEYCEYYRITGEQFDVIKNSRNQIQFAEYLVKLGILDQWRTEAGKAIAELEKLTGLTFVNDSKRSQLVLPTEAEIKAEAEKVAAGYYTPEAEAAREKQKTVDYLNELEAEKQKAIDKAVAEFEVKKEVLLKGGIAAAKNCIYYTHTKTVAFNWKSYEQLPVEFINDLIPKLVLSEGVKAEISKK